MSHSIKKLKVLTYNIHKGFGLGIKKYSLLRMREEIRKSHPDLIFLQEVYGHNSSHKKRISDWPDMSQFEYLAEEIWPHFSYGKNAVYEDGHHGNAILSKYPILSWENFDISTNPLEKRGLLHATLQLPSGMAKVHAFCTHLNLFASGRKMQLKMLSEQLLSLPKKEILILAGDFNDWQQSANSILKKNHGLEEAFFVQNGQCAKTFPSFFPFLCLDRVYFRGLNLSSVERLSDFPWTSLSDHLPIEATFHFQS